jgi:hypothetical protein
MLRLVQASETPLTRCLLDSREKAIPRKSGTAVPLILAMPPEFDRSYAVCQLPLPGNGTGRAFRYPRDSRDLIFINVLNEASRLNHLNTWNKLSIESGE